jgi:hypothetical protein
MYAYMCLRTYVRKHTCMYVSMYVWRGHTPQAHDARVSALVLRFRAIQMHVCTYVRTYVRLYVYTLRMYVCMYTRSAAHPKHTAGECRLSYSLPGCTHTCMHVHTYVRLYVKTWGFPSHFINQPRGYGHTTRATPGVSLPGTRACVRTHARGCAAQAHGGRVSGRVAA